MVNSNVSTLPTDLQKERSCFDGILVSALAYGALLMLYIQLVQVLLSRPRRNRKFWAITIYSSILFPLASIAIGGMLKFTEMAYIDGPSENKRPADYYTLHASDSINVMGQICTTLVPWIGDVLMLYRLSVVWDKKKWIVIFPGALYLSRVAMSIPLLIADTQPMGSSWKAKVVPYGTAFYALCVSLNIFITATISFRIYTMRRKVESVMGRLHASFYTGFVTILVESGAFFTVWAVTYVITRARNSNRQEIFLLPYTHVLAITRMLIVLRMAQDRAWSKDLVTATTTGVLDWQVSSTHSVPLHDVPASSMSSLPNKSLPAKFREDVS